MKIDILGTDWDIKYKEVHEDTDLETVDGYCDETSKECVVRRFVEEKNRERAKADLDVHTRKCMRHEIIHAFLFESGLAENSDWAMNEEMIDWIAIQFPKILKAIEKAKAL